MNRFMSICLVFILAVPIGRAQDLSQPTPVGTPFPRTTQPSPYPPAEAISRPAESKRIVIQPGVDAQESEVAMQFMADLEAAGIAKMNAAKMTPTSGSPILMEVFMREDESFEKIKQFIVDLRASGVERLVLEFGGLHPEGADEQHNGMFFRATKGYSQDELERLETVVQEAAQRCGLSLYLAGTAIAPSVPIFIGPGDQEAVKRDAAGFSRPAVPQLRTDYEAASKQAHDLAKSLRQAPDAAKTSELRTAVQQAFTLRQSLLRSELLEMQTRLLETQRSIDMRERIADQIVDRRVEDLLNPQLDWEGSSTSRPAVVPTSNSAKPASPPPFAVAITELEGDWHLVANITKWGTERRPRNLTIRGDRWTGTIWDGTSVSSSLVVDSKARTIDFGTLKGKLPILKVNEQGTYEFRGDLLTIHSESTIVDSEIGTQKQQQTNIWKRGLVEIRDYDSRNPGKGMDLFYLNGNHEDTGQGKLIPGDKVDVIVSFASLNENPIRRVLAERLEVDGSSNLHPQISLLGTREQCLLLHNAPKHGKLSLAARKPEDDTLQYPDGINREAFQELETAAASGELKDE